MTMSEEKSKKMEKGKIPSRENRRLSISFVNWWEIDK